MVGQVPKQCNYRVSVESNKLTTNFKRLQQRQKPAPCKSRTAVRKNAIAWKDKSLPTALAADVRFPFVWI